MPILVTFTYGCCEIENYGQLIVVMLHMAKRYQVRPVYLSKYVYAIVVETAINNVFIYGCLRFSSSTGFLKSRTYFLQNGGDSYG